MSVIPAVAPPSVTGPRVDQLRFGRASAFSADLFTAPEVTRIREAVDTVPARFRHRREDSPGEQALITIGAPLYRNRDVLDEYRAAARSSNRELYRHFRLAHERIAAFFEHRYGVPVVYAEDLAVPGFHVFSFEYPGSFPGGGWHMDGMAFQVPFFADRRAEIEGVLNFTVPFEIPDGGSGMNFEDSIPGSLTPGGGAAVTLPFRPGAMLFTEADHWHRIGDSHCLSPGRRITMQGHGLRFRGRWVLFW
jgi:hypothetical protein